MQDDIKSDTETKYLSREMPASNTASDVYCDHITDEEILWRADTKRIPDIVENGN